MSRTKKVHPNEELKIKQGPPELAIYFDGDKSDGRAEYFFKSKGQKAKQQSLSGRGSVQIYENVRYPIKVHNVGGHSVAISVAS